MNAALGVAKRLRAHRGVALLHSARNDDGCGQRSFVACEPVQSIEARGRIISLYDRSGMVREQFEGDPLEVLQELVQEHTRRWGEDIVGPVPVAIGYLGFDSARLLEPFPAGTARSVDDAPDMWFGLYDAVWRFDEKSRKSDIVGKSAGARRSLAEAIARGDDSARRPPVFDPLLGQGSHPNLSADDERAEYAQRVAQVLQHIKNGTVQHLTLARRLVAEIREAGDPIALYSALTRTAPSPFGAYITVPYGEQGSGICVMSGSSARFLARASGSSTVEARPSLDVLIKGDDPEADKQAVEAMSDSDERRVAHRLITQATSADLGRLAVGPVAGVDEPAHIVDRPHRYQLVSQLSCELRPNASAADILRTMFPHATTSGTPRNQALGIIDAVEPTRRGIHSGAIGYLGLYGAMDMALATTTAVYEPHKLVVHTSSHITSISTPEAALERSEQRADWWRSIWDLT